MGGGSVIQPLEAWFSANAPQYIEMLEYMCNLAVDHIPRFLGGSVQIPQAAWIGGAIAAFDALATYRDGGQVTNLSAISK